METLVFQWLFVILEWFWHTSLLCKKKYWYQYWYWLYWPHICFVWDWYQILFYHTPVLVCLSSFQPQLISPVDMFDERYFCLSCYLKSFVSEGGSKTSVRGLFYYWHRRSNESSVCFAFKCPMVKIPLLSHTCSQLCMYIHKERFCQKQDNERFILSSSTTLRS